MAKKSAAKEADKAPQSNFVVRSKEAVASAAGTLGWSNLTDPDDKFDPPAFKARLHLTEAAVEKMGQIIQDTCIDPLRAALEKEAKEKAPGKKLVYQTGQQWVQEHLQPMLEGARIQLPNIQIKRKADYKNRKGEVIRSSILAWDSKNGKLDLKSLRLGMGSLVQIIFDPGIFFGPLTKVSKDKKDQSYYVVPCPRLLGIRVLKLEQYGAGSRGPAAEVSDEDLSVLDSDFQPEDLSGFMQSQHKPTPKEDAPEDRQHSKPDPDDELPF